MITTTADAATEAALSPYGQPLPPGWRLARLGDVCVINPRRPVVQRDDEAPTTFVPMPAVEVGGKGIARPETKSFATVRKGYTYFGEGDVLFAKITPCMQNGKHAVARDLIDGIGFGSTEFHVLRPAPDITPEWLHCFVIQPHILHEAEAHLTGAVGQQRLPESFLANLNIPLPPLPEQRRIAAILREQLAAVERARAAAEAQLAAARELPAAYLRGVFDGEKARQWPKRRLGDVLILRKDVVYPKNNPAGPAQFVGLEHIESRTGVRHGSAPLEMAKLTGRKPRFYKGDIVYGYLRPYLNKVWLAEFDGLCSVDQYVFAVRPELAVPEFVAWYMRSPTYLDRAPIDTTPGQLPRIRTEEVASVAINLPSIDEQRHTVASIAHDLDYSRRVRTAIEQQLDAVDKLPATLLRRAFNGEL